MRRLSLIFESSFWVIFHFRLATGSLHSNRPNRPHAPLMSPAGSLPTAEDIKSSLVAGIAIGKVSVQLQQKSHHAVTDLAFGKLGRRGGWGIGRPCLGRYRLVKLHDGRGRFKCVEHSPESRPAG